MTPEQAVARGAPGADRRWATGVAAWCNHRAVPMVVAAVAAAIVAVAFTGVIAAPEVAVVELSTDGVAVQIRPAVRYVDRWQVTYDLREAIVARFASAGVRLASPPEADVRLTPCG